MADHLRWRVRPASPADVDAAVAVVRAAETADVGEPLRTRADLMAEWSRPGMDPAADVRLAEMGGRLVAVADQYQGRASVAVAPDARGLGIGTALAAWTEAHARAAGLARVGQTVPAAAHDAVRLLTGRGYAPRWDSWVFRRTLLPDEPGPTLPPGVMLRTLRRPAEDAAVHALIERAFSEWPDRQDPAMSFEDWRATMLAHDDVRDDLLLVLEARGALIGAALAMVDGEEGWIDQLAVAREWRGTGLGRALLQAAFQRFADHGLRTAALSTDSRTGARAVYEHVGMQVVLSFRRFSLPLW